jgi:RNA polymerase sigma-70 factor (ECF subfamily)
MTQHDVLARQFEANRPRLREIAYKMLGSASEAEDAVQEAWLRLGRSEMTSIENLSGWLTTVVARVCLDMLRSRASRREEPLDEDETDLTASPTSEFDPEREALLADSVGLALLVVLDALTPVERIAFVLHDVFAVPFDVIAPIVERTPAATRQLASRARRRVQGTSAAADNLSRQRVIVDAFLAASRNGDFAALLALLDPDVVLRADPAAVATGATDELRGAADVGKQFAGRARVAQPALVDGAAGAVWAVNGRARVAFAFTFADERILAIHLIADPDRLRHVAFACVGDGS